MRKQILAAGKFTRLIKQGHWEYAERTGCRGAVVIVAVTDDRKLLLTEQYRIPVAAPVIELPAGLVGDDPDSADEAWTDAARRELLEETGYRAARVKQLASGPISAGFSNETVWFIGATRLKRVGEGGGIESEDIQVHEIPLEDIRTWLRRQERKQKLVDPKVFAGLYFAEELISAPG